MLLLSLLAPSSTVDRQSDRTAGVARTTTEGPLSAPLDFPMRRSRAAPISPYFGLVRWHDLRFHSWRASASCRATTLHPHIRLSCTASHNICDHYTAARLCDAVSQQPASYFWRTSWTSLPRLASQ